MKNKNKQMMLLMVTFFVFCTGILGINSVYGDNEKIHCEMSDTLSADKSESIIQLKVIPRDENVKIIKIVHPDLSVIKDQTESNYKVNSNNTYEFIIYYKVAEVSNDTATLKEDPSQNNIVWIEQEKKVQYRVGNIEKQTATKSEETIVNAPVIDSTVLTKGSIEINEVNFPDEHFRNYLFTDTVNIKGYGNDDVFTPEELNDIETIDISRMIDISSLKGIEYFTSLKNLIADYNTITEIDISKNTELLNLQVTNNKLVALDVSANQKLVNINTTNNKISTINIGNLTSLTSLNVTQNSISTLDIRRCIKLQNLNFSYNKVSTVDLSQNSDLISINGNTNLLTELDIANNLRLRFLDCGDNSITSLDVRPHLFLEELCFENAFIREIDVSKNTALVSLVFGNNPMSSIDISNNVNLEIISCVLTPIKKIDLSNNIKLKTMNLEGMGLSEIDVSMLPLLNSLTLINNDLTELDISNNPLLTFLECSTNQLRWLDLSNNPELTIIISNSNCLTSLDLTNQNKLSYFSALNQSITVSMIAYDGVIKSIDGVFTPGSDISFNSSNYSLTETGAIKSTVAHNEVVSFTSVSNGKSMRGEISFKMLEAKDGFIDFNAAKTLTDIKELIIYNFGEVDVNLDDITVACDFEKIKTGELGSYPITYTIAGKIETVNLEVGVEVNETNFPDANFRDFFLTDSGLTNGYGLDGKLTLIELDSITGLNLDNKNISNLKGIEYFKYLSTLDCSGNQLTELDISQNVNLVYLKCSSNQLTALNISNNILLENLNCDQNQIRQLNITKQTLLSTLICKSNQLTMLDVSQNPLLSSIEFGHNQIQDIDISQNVNLFSVSGDVNQLTKIDTSKNIKLENMTVNSNKIETLDMSKNAKLKYLQAGNNQLKSLDVSSNTALQILYCNDNQLTKLDLSKNNGLMMVLAHNQKITLDFNLIGHDYSNPNRALTFQSMQENVFDFSTVTTFGESAMTLNNPFVQLNYTGMNNPISFSTGTNAVYGFKLSGTITPILKGTMNISSGYVNTKEIIEMPVETDKDAIKFGLINLWQSEGLDYTMNIAISSFEEFKQGIVGQYSTQYQIQNMGDIEFSPTTPITKKIEVLIDDYVISSDRQKAITAKNFTVGLDGIETITRDALLQKAQALYKEIDGIETTDISEFEITDETFNNITSATVEGDISLELIHKASGLRKTIIVHIFDNSPAGFVILPKEIKLQTNEEGGNIVADATAEIKLVSEKESLLDRPIYVYTDSLVELAMISQPLSEMTANVYKPDDTLYDKTQPLATLQTPSDKSQMFSLRVLNDHTYALGNYSGVMHFIITY